MVWFHSKHNKWDTISLVQMFHTLHLCKWAKLLAKRVHRHDFYFSKQNQMEIVCTVKIECIMRVQVIVVFLIGNGGSIH